MKILVVDDEISVCQTITGMLSQLGHTSCSATSADQALTRCAEEAFDLIITDLGMPGINGLELAQRVRAHMPQVRIILITGWPVQLDAEQLSEYGVECVIKKPLTLKALQTALAGHASVEETRS
ncbi:MAG: response regulator [Acidobacteria bacterium]|nr:MAG: response regulator [Acidobacteriota bacterium]